MKIKRMCSYVMVIICFLMTILSTGNLTAAANTLEGDGTQESPYLLSEPDDFFLMGANPKAHYKLKNDIDFNYVEQFTLPTFKGILDGNHHTLKNLNIVGDLELPGGDWGVALFLSFSDVTVKDLTIDNFTTFGDAHEFAFLAAFSNDSTFTNITVKNSTINCKYSSTLGAISAEGRNITATDCRIINTSINGSNYCGSMFGMLDKSTLINCTSESGKVGGYSEVGGIVGRTNNVTLLQCHSTSNVTGISEIGGLVGIAYGPLFISECSVNGNVSANTMVGGLVGSNLTYKVDEQVKIRDSYYIGTITAANADSIAGGLASSKIDLIQDSYAVSSIQAGTRYGLSVSGEIQNSYYNGEISGIEGLHARTTKVMQQKSNYQYWDFNKTWKIEDGKTYPTLIRQPNPEPKREMKIILELGEQIRLSVDDDILENETLNWSSSAPSVASVDSSGMITAHAEGNAVITVTNDDSSYTERIRILVINNAKDYRLAVDLFVGKTCRLTFDENTGTSNITWTSSDPLVAAVSNEGKVQALKKGLTIVTASDDSGNEEQVYIRVRE